jgi:hypothetical protein
VRANIEPRRLGIGELRGEQVEHHSNASTGVEFAVCHQPDWKHQWIQIRQNALYERLCVANVAIQYADPETVLNEFPHNKVVFGHNGKILSCEIEADRVQAVP